MTVRFFLTATSFASQCITTRKDWMYSFVPLPCCDMAQAGLCDLFWLATAPCAAIWRPSLFHWGLGMMLTLWGAKDDEMWHNCSKTAKCSFYRQGLNLSALF